MNELTKTLRANAAFSFICGILGTLFARPLAVAFLNIEAGLGFWLVLGTGIALTSFGLIVFATLKFSYRWLVGLINLTDAIWVTGSFALIALAWPAFTTAGIAFVAFQAVTVSIFAFRQFGYLSETEPQSPPANRSTISTGKAITQSWLSLKLWVKIWLFTLNGIFLVSLFFMDDPAGPIVLTAYALTGPLLMGMMVAQRGLTRLLGVAHLIPWLPLTAYLVFRLSSDGRFSAVTVWLGILLASLLICLVFDIYDTKKWFAGERSRFGAPDGFAKL